MPKMGLGWDRGWMHHFHLRGIWVNLTFWFSINSPNLYHICGKQSKMGYFSPLAGWGKGWEFTYFMEMLNLLKTPTLFHICGK